MSSVVLEGCTAICADWLPLTGSALSHHSEDCAVHGIASPPPVHSCTCCSAGSVPPRSASKYRCSGVSTMRCGFCGTMCIVRSQPLCAPCWSLVHCHWMSFGSVSAIACVGVIFHQRVQEALGRMV